MRINGEKDNSLYRSGTQSTLPLQGGQHQIQTNSNWFKTQQELYIVTAQVILVNFYNYSEGGGLGCAVKNAKLRANNDSKIIDIAEMVTFYGTSPNGDA